MLYADLKNLSHPEQLAAVQSSPAGQALGTKGFIVGVGGGYLFEREEQNGSNTYVLTTGEDHGPLELEEPVSVYAGVDPSGPIDFSTLAAYLATL